MTMNGIETAFIARVGTEPELLKVSQAGKPWTSLSACVGDGDEAQWVRPSPQGRQDLRRRQAEARHLDRQGWQGAHRYQGRGVARRAAGPDRQEQARQAESTAGRRGACAAINGSATRLAEAGVGVRRTKGANQHDHRPLIRVRLVASYGTKRTRELDDLEFSGATYD
jgi:hypothetical protein